MKKILVQIDNEFITKYRCTKCGKIYDENYKRTVSHCKKCHRITCLENYHKRWSYVNILDTKSQTFLCCTSS